MHEIMDARTDTDGGHVALLFGRVQLMALSDGSNLVEDDS
jgi:hypothetical protein